MHQTTLGSSSLMELSSSRQCLITLAPVCTLGTLELSGHSGCIGGVQLHQLASDGASGRFSELVRLWLQKNADPARQTASHMLRRWRHSPHARRPGNRSLGYVPELHHHVPRRRRLPRSEHRTLRRIPGAHGTRRASGWWQTQPRSRLPAHHEKDIIHQTAQSSSTPREHAS